MFKSLVRDDQLGPTVLSPLSHPKCVIFQEVEETGGSLSFLPNRQLHSASARLASTPPAALKSRREIKRESFNPPLYYSDTQIARILN